MILLTFYLPKEFNIFCYLFCRSHVIDIVDDFPVKTNFRKSLSQKDQQQQLVLPAIITIVMLITNLFKMIGKIRYT